MSNSSVITCVTWVRRGEAMSLPQHVRIQYCEWLEVCGNYCLFDCMHIWIVEVSIWSWHWLIMIRRILALKIISCIAMVNCYSISWQIHSKTIHAGTFVTNLLQQRSTAGILLISRSVIHLKNYMVTFKPLKIPRNHTRSVPWHVTAVLSIVTAKQPLNY